jgi:glycosyltransferase involved in cell wall biosynthesis
MPDARHVGLVLAPRGAGMDAIGDYTQLLVSALRQKSVEADLLEWRADDVTGDLGALVIQYNPFSFGRWGFAPRLPLFLARLRRRRRRPRIAVMFHETYVDMRSPSWVLMGSWQRAQLVAVQAGADIQFCSIQRWTERLRRTAFGRPIHHLPVPSNLPDARAEREHARRRIGADPDTLVLGCLGLRHPGRLPGHVLAAARAARAAGSPAVLVLDLGPGEPSEKMPVSHVHLRSTGFLDAPDLASHIAATDVFLAPYMDGVSTRRGSMMAALQHAVPVVGTYGHLTDDMLRDAACLTLVPVNGSNGYAQAVAALATDSARRAELGAAGRRMYERHFDWPVHVDLLRKYLHV